MYAMIGRQYTMQIHPNIGLRIWFSLVIVGALTLITIGLAAFFPFVLYPYAVRLLSFSSSHASQTISFLSFQPR